MHLHISIRKTSQRARTCMQHCLTRVCVVFVPYRSLYNDSRSQAPPSQSPAKATTTLQTPGTPRFCKWYSLYIFPSLATTFITGITLTVNTRQRHQCSVMFPCRLVTVILVMLVMTATMLDLHYPCPRAPANCSCVPGVWQKIMDKSEAYKYMTCELLLWGVTVIYSLHYHISLSLIPRYFYYPRPSQLYLTPSLGTFLFLPLLTPHYLSTLSHVPDFTPTGKQLLHCFSLTQNWTRLMSYSTAETHLQTLDGIRWWC